MVVTMLAIVPGTATARRHRGQEAGAAVACGSTGMLTMEEERHTLPASLPAVFAVCSGEHARSAE